jgi:ribonuclease HI
MNEIIVYTDGSCLNNPGKGGYAAVILEESGEKIISGGYKYTTNNRMEILAIINAVKYLNNYSGKITVYTDSRLICDTINKGWLQNWKRKGWIKSDKKPVLNKDLWSELDVCMRGKNISINWVKAHAGTHYNEQCDQIARDMASIDNLPSDINYERNDVFDGLFNLKMDEENIQTSEKILAEEQLTLEMKLKLVEAGGVKNIILEKGKK